MCDNMPQGNRDSQSPMLSSRLLRRWHTIKDLRTSSSRTDMGLFFMMLIGLQEWIMKMKIKMNSKKMLMKVKSMKTVKNRT